MKRDSHHSQTVIRHNVSDCLVLMIAFRCKIERRQSCWNIRNVSETNLIGFDEVREEKVMSHLIINAINDWICLIHVRFLEDSIDFWFF